MDDGRITLLSTWATAVATAAMGGALDGGKLLSVRAVETVRGPRAGALEIDAGIDAGRLVRVLTANDCALHRQFIPWDFCGIPTVYMAGRYVRLEAGWPDALAEHNIPLSSLPRHPVGDGRWVAGKNETGATVTLGLDDAKPHWLFGGFTGSGKTWAIRAAVAQLARNQNKIILIDGKFGDGLACLQGVPGLVGPLALDLDDARAALSWAVSEMRARYEAGGHTGRLVVVIDEVQEFTQDDAFAELLRRLTAQGRAAGVHVIVGTQNPLQAVFNDPSIKRNLTGRFALRVDSFEASKAVTGSATPRADTLLGAGDAYAITPAAAHRLQAAYVPQGDLEALRNCGPMFQTWPDYDPTCGGTLPDVVSGFQVGPVEAAETIIAALHGSGRPTLARNIEGATGSKPGGDRGRRLLDYGKEAAAHLTARGFMLCEIPGAQAMPVN